MAKIKTALRSLLFEFPWPLCWMWAIWKRYDRFLPWRFPRSRKAIRSAEAARLRPRLERQVVFVSNAPRMREAKIARGLKLAGWEVILLSRDQPGFDVDFYFTRHERYSDSWGALKLASAFSPLAYHVFACMIYDTVQIFVR